MRKPIGVLGAFLVVIGTILLAGCGPAGGSSDPELIGQVWILTALMGEPPLAGTSITAEFDKDGNVSGSAGCNSYSGPYELDGNEISFGPLITTMMMCEPAVTAQETTYLAALESAATFRVQDGYLVLYNADNAAVTAYEVVEQTLPGTSWQVTSYNTGTGAVSSLIIGTEILAIFGEDGAPSEGGASHGELTGNAGCNDYFASYETEGATISIGPRGATRKFCQEPEGVMEQEAAYLAALETAATYKIRGLDMEMRTADGAKVAGFKRAPGP